MKTQKRTVKVVLLCLLSFFLFDAKPLHAKSSSNYDLIDCQSIEGIQSAMLGTCDMQPCGTAARAIEPSIVSIGKQAMEVIVAPNPSTTQFELVIKTKNTEPVSIKVMDATGKLVQSMAKVSANSYITVGSSCASEYTLQKFCKVMKEK